MTARSIPSQIVGLLGWLLLAFLAAGIGAVASIHAAEFYAQLDKPAWAPPASVFGPVWSILYTMMGVAAWLVWRSPREGYGALSLFCAQLAANTLWSWLFFGWHLGALAAIEVLILLMLIALTLRAFWSSSRWSGILLIPYLLWVTFASALTWAIWRANPSLL
jgi:tryptophan-rich sensory protein